MVRKGFLDENLSSFQSRLSSVATLERLLWILLAATRTMMTSECSRHPRWTLVSFAVWYVHNENNKLVRVFSKGCVYCCFFVIVNWKCLFCSKGSESRLVQRVHAFWRAKTASLLTITGLRLPLSRYQHFSARQVLFYSFTWTMLVLANLLVVIFAIVCSSNRYNLARLFPHVRAWV